MPFHLQHLGFNQTSLISALMMILSVEENLPKIDHLGIFTYLFGLGYNENLFWQIRTRGA